jgi:SAM-dependent methyltransferase
MEHTIFTRYQNDGKAAIEMTVAQKEGRRLLMERLKTGAYQIQPRNCELCSSSTFTIIAEKERYGIPMRIGICQACGLLQATEVMRQADYIDFFSNIYRALCGALAPTAKEGFINEQKRGQSFLKLVQQEIPSSEGSNVLEVGCGSGGILSVFAKAGYSVQGYDLDDDCLDYGRSQGLDLRKGALQSIDFQGKYDVVIASLLLQYLPNLKAMIEKLRSLIRPGGYLVLEIAGLYDLATPGNRYHKELMRLLHFICLTYPEKELLTATIENCGFHCVYADELVRGVFKRHEGSPPPFIPSSEKHDEVLLFIQTLHEQWRRQRIGLSLRKLGQHIKAKAQTGLSRLA